MTTPTQLYIVNKYSSGFSYFQNISLAISYMKTLRENSSVSVLNYGESYNKPPTPIFYSHYKYDLKEYFIMDKDGEKFYDDEEEKRYNDVINYYAEKERIRQQKIEEKHRLREQLKKTNEYRYSLKRMPFLGWCDYPEQFAIKCDKYHGRVSFKKVVDPEYVFKNIMSIKNKGCYGKDLTTARYIGNHTIEDGTKLKDSGLNEIWVFETKMFGGRYCNRFDKYLKAKNGSLYDPKVRDFSSDSSTYREDDFSHSSDSYDSDSQ